MLEVLVAFDADQVAIDVVDTALHDQGFAVLRPANIHNRIAAANGVDLGSLSGDDARRLRVPYVASSHWTAMTQQLSKRRAVSPRVAVLDPNLSLFLPLWQHLMAEALVLHYDDPATPLGDVFDAHLAADR